MPDHWSCPSFGLPETCEASVTATGSANGIIRSERSTTSTDIHLPVRPFSPSRQPPVPGLSRTHTNCLLVPIVVRVGLPLPTSSTISSRLSTPVGPKKSNLCVSGPKRIEPRAVASTTDGTGPPVRLVSIHPSPPNVQLKTPISYPYLTQLPWQRESERETCRPQPTASSRSSTSVSRL
ncbi:unnamed protein product [Protopolystoma xenopodis]|uniref:Uncharacterized protein n=1 Tax=Protopolystoma xenopodis TaxID=117903 RepID=A0A3S5B4J2_9PLAT|nr:unnamed protein product [Protopolystoma xenopodis]